MAEENPIFTKPTIYSGEKYDNVHEFVYLYEMTAVGPMVHENIFSHVI